jgi:uncharacterized membrane protein
MDEAADLGEALHEADLGDDFRLDDSFVVVRDQDGKVHVKDEMHRGKKVGAIGGGILGVLVASLFFPAAALLAAGVAMGLAAREADTGIEPEFIQEAADYLRPGTSALCVRARRADLDLALAVLERYHGLVYHTSLPTDAGLRHREAMSDGG